MIKRECKQPDLGSYADTIRRMFDYEPSETICFERSIPEFPSQFSVGVIVGPSGSGKTVLSQEVFGEHEPPYWCDTLSVIGHFESDGVDRLCGAGLRSVPDWCKPYFALSTGARHRADIARNLRYGSVIDEFTSVVDRNTAKSLSVSAAKYIRRNDIKNVVFCTCHYDVLDWLEPDWVFDTSLWQFAESGCLRRPNIELDLTPCQAEEIWPLFAQHHYLTADINRSCNAWLCRAGGVSVGFTSIIAFPNAHFKNAWREHRTVILPEFQGLGLGRAAVELVADHVVHDGGRFFSKTTHPAFGIYRNASSKWRQTTKNGKSREDYATSKTVTKEDGHKMNHVHRVAYSHEYIG